MLTKESEQNKISDVPVHVTIINSGLIDLNDVRHRNGCTSIAC